MMKKWSKPVMVATLATWWSVAVMAQDNYVQNGDFDTDVAGWALIGDEGETMDWDGAIGSPLPGSLRLTAINSSSSGPTAASECISIAGGSTWELRAMVREAPGSAALNCGLLLLLHDLPDCSDPTAAVVADNSLAGNDWTPLSLTYTAQGEYLGIRAGPSMGVGVSANGSCNFDSVRLLGPPSLDVPVLDRGGLLALVAVLAGAGVLLLRRQR